MSCCDLETGGGHRGRFLLQCTGQRELRNLQTAARPSGEGRGKSPSPVPRSFFPAHALCCQHPAEGGGARLAQFYTWQQAQVWGCIWCGATLDKSCFKSSPRVTQHGDLPCSWMGEGSRGGVSLLIQRRCFLDVFSLFLVWEKALLVLRYIQLLSYSTI